MLSHFHVAIQLNGDVSDAGAAVVDDERRFGQFVDREDQLAADKGQEEDQHQYGKCDHEEHDEFDDLNSAKALAAPKDRASAG